MGLYGQIPEENRGFVDTTVFRTIPKFNPADELRWDEQRSARVHAQGRSAQRPVRVNNAERIYFPPIFHQENASCTAASRIAYMFTYEQNAARRLDGSVEENQYPTHYNWLHYYQNTDYPSVLRDHGVPNAVTYGGRTYSKDFGADQNWYSNDYGWMQGYDKWYSAMFNRIDRSAMFPQNVRTEAGREAVKQRLWNHSGDDSFDAGGVCAIDIGFVEGFHTGTVPQTTVNKEIGAAGEGYVVRWGVAVDHSMVVVGYDDRVEFDLDGNGIAGEKDKDEVGAWIVANTWGETWDGNGLIYCPYKTAVCIGTDGAGMPDQYYRGYWMPDVYFVRRDYRPLRTMKMALDFSHRSEITLVAGVASDTATTEPERTVAMEYFKFAGNGMKLDDNIYPDAATPMLGRWADGTLHTEPMELGYDLTALTEGFDLRKPLKYFFIIESKQSAQGVGRVHNLSVIDYEFDAHGIETMAQLPEEGVSIQNKGGRTVLSVVMSGESFPMPRNLTGASGKLQWEAPAASAYSVSGFRIYQGKTSVADVAAGQMEYALEAGASGRYSVVALYDFCGKSVESGAAEIYVSDRPEMSAQNLVRELWGASFTVPDIFDEKYHSATIEFWLKPGALTDYNQQIGLGWGKFLFHSSASSDVTAGWTTNSRTTTPGGMLAVGRWNHVALVVSGNELKIYIDGQERASLINNQQTGIGGFGDLVFGSNGQKMSGLMDELRIWSVARTAEQIRSMKNVAIARPELQAGLLACYQMDSFTKDGATYLYDAAGGHHAQITSGTGSSVADAGLAFDASALKASFTVPLAEYYVGQEVLLHSDEAPNAVRWAWDAPDAGVASLNRRDAELVFSEPGEHEVTLQVFDIQGNSDQSTARIKVVPLPDPDATFTASATVVPASDRIIFQPVQDLAVNSYEWTIPGSSQEKIYTKQAAVSFPKEGKYTVTLKVTNPNGSQMYSMEVETMSVAPKVAFVVTPDVVVKGEKTYLEDRTEYSPETWEWELVNGDYRLLVHGQNTSFVTTETGKYDVTLTATNKQGSDRMTKVGALVVCNADGGRGLRFYGDEARVVYKSPFTRAVNEFTIDWWMMPNTLQIKGNGIGSHAGELFLFTEADGAMTLQVEDTSVKSVSGFVRSGEWHHYAVTFQNGLVTFYRDGVVVGQAQQMAVGQVPELKDAFVLGGSEAPMYGVIDELQVWNAVLSLDDLRRYANAPIRPDNEPEPEIGATAGTVSDAMKAGLTLYSPFNQNSGDVQDLTTNANTGRREGFGPDGDAWSSSKGIFWLNFNERQVEDITSRYLTNYMAPFLHATTPFYADVVSGYNHYALETGTAQSGWILENELTGNNGSGGDDGKGDGKDDGKDEGKDEGTASSIVTGFHVTDGMYKSCMSVECGRGFAFTLPNHKAYQTITLPAGFYQFSVSFGPYSKTLESYLVVSAGAGLPDVANVSEALAYTDLANGKLTFQLAEETEVSLGVLINWTDENNWGCITIDRFSLGEIPYDEIDGNGETGIECVQTAVAEEVSVRAVRGGLYVSSDEPQLVQIYTVSGAKVFQERVVGTRPIMLSPGVYIVNRQKVMVP